MYKGEPTRTTVGARKEHLFEVGPLHVYVSLVSKLFSCVRLLICVSRFRVPASQLRVCASQLRVHASLQLRVRALSRLRVRVKRLLVFGGAILAIVVDVERRDKLDAALIESDRMAEVVDGIIRIAERQIFGKQSNGFDSVPTRVLKKEGYRSIVQTMTNQTPRNLVLISMENVFLKSLRRLRPSSSCLL